MHYLARVAQHILGRPLFVLPAKLEIVAEFLGGRIGVDAGDFDESRRDFMAQAGSAAALALAEPAVLKPSMNRMLGEPVMMGRGFLYNRVDGVGIIPIVGTLINRGAFFGDDGSGFVSYEGIAATIQAAMADPKVGAIMLDVDSPGGEAAGLFSLAALIRAARAKKPVHAMVNDMAASAGYGIVSSATDITVTPTSITGSIGTVMMHTDRSKEMEQRGRKVTLITSDGADHKMDGNSFSPLSSESLGRLRETVNAFNEQFLTTVNAGRPALTTDALRALRGGIKLGAEATAFGLADHVGTFEETVARIGATIRAQHQLGGYRNMTDTLTRAEHDAAIATARAQARSEGETAGIATGRQQAFDSIRAVMALPEAEGRQPLALVFALEGMNADVAKRALAASPLTTAKAPTPPLHERGNPPLAGGPGNANERPTAAASWDSVVAEQNETIKARNPRATRHHQS